MALERNVKKKPARTADRRNVWLLILTTLLIVVSVVLLCNTGGRVFYRALCIWHSG